MCSQNLFYIVFVIQIKGENSRGNSDFILNQTQKGYNVVLKNVNKSRLVTQRQAKSNKYDEIYFILQFL